MEYRENLIALIQPIYTEYEEQIIPATHQQLTDFKNFARQKLVPDGAIDELVKFYQITNGIPCLDSLAIHQIDDIILFEWWEDKELWIGQRDFYTIRWKDDKFHLGDASNLNYGALYIADDIYGILKIGMADWYVEDESE